MDPVQSFTIKRNKRGLLVVRFHTGHTWYQELMMPDDVAASLGHQLLIESDVVANCVRPDGSISHDFIGDRCVRCKLVLHS